MRTIELIKTIDDCIDVLNEVKQTLTIEANNIDNNSLIKCAVNHFVEKLSIYVNHYSEPFMKRDHGNNKNGKM